MKFKPKNTAIVDVSLKGLSDPERQRFQEMLIKNDVKFNYDIERQQYIALLQIDKDVKTVQKSKSMNNVRIPNPPRIVTARTQKHFHQDCNDLFLAPRPFIGARTMHPSIKATQNGDDFPTKENTMNSRSKSPNVPKALSVINLREGAAVVKTRLDVLARYQHCFPHVDFSKVFFTPVHISKPFLVRKIEFFYNKQFDVINRFKAQNAIQLAKVIYDFLYSKYKDTPNYYQQSLVNLLYSVDRYHESPEIDLFQQFLGEKAGSLRLLFYLYIRQIFKIVTSTFFLNHKVDEADPSKIKISKDQAFAIVEQTFYGNDHYYGEAISALERRLINKPSIKYYSFMVFMTKLEIDYWVIS